jgi:hypothetical protein
MHIFLESFNVSRRRLKQIANAVGVTGQEVYCGNPNVRSVIDDDFFCSPYLTWTDTSPIGVLRETVSGYVPDPNA